MSTNRTRKTRERTGGRLTGRQLEHLIYGWSLGYARGTMPFADDAERRAAWFSNRDYIVSLEGIDRVPGVFGRTPLKSGRKPQAMLDYER